MKNVKLALATGFATAVRTAYALVRHINPSDMGYEYESRDGKRVVVLNDITLDEFTGFDYWFAHQPKEVREYSPEYARGCRVAPEYFWRGVFAQLFCHYHRAAWYASERPGPFEWNAADYAVRQGKRVVVMEGLS
jgi:hypothetical protein